MLLDYKRITRTKKTSTSTWLLIVGLVAELPRKIFKIKKKWVSPHHAMHKAYVGLRTVPAPFGAHSLHLMGAYALAIFIGMKPGAFRSVTLIKKKRAAHDGDKPTHPVGHRLEFSLSCGELAGLSRSCGEHLGEVNRWIKVKNWTAHPLLIIR
jgi:hypothetical protein